MRKMSSHAQPHAATLVGMNPRKYQGRHQDTPSPGPGNPSGLVSKKPEPTGATRVRPNGHLYRPSGRILPPKRLRQGRRQVSRGRSGNPGPPLSLTTPHTAPHVTPSPTPHAKHQHPQGCTRHEPAAQGRERRKGLTPGVLALKRGVQGTASAWGPAPPAAPAEAESPFRTETRTKRLPSPPAAG